jgi:hypothetical protein
MDKMKYALIALMLLCSPVHAKDWSTTEKTLFATYLTLSAYDAAQSWHVWTDPRFEEQNPLFKSRTHMIVGKTLVAAGTYWVVDKMPRGQGVLPLIIMVIVQGAVVAHNESIGAGVSISF